MSFIEKHKQGCYEESKHWQWNGYHKYIFPTNIVVDVTFQFTTLYMLRSVICRFMSPWWLLGWHFLWISEQMFVKDDGWVHPLAKTPSFLCQQLVMKYRHRGLESGYNHLVTDSDCYNIHRYKAKTICKKWERMVG